MSSQSESAFYEYIEECQEMLDRLSQNISLTEKNGFNKEIIASIYRDMHTIKGSAQLFGFSKIANLAHTMETCLDPIRKEKIKLSKELLDSIYLGINFIILALEKVKETKKEPELKGELEKLFIKFVTSIEMVFTKIQPIAKDKWLVSDQVLTLDRGLHVIKETDKVTENLDQKKSRIWVF